MTTVTERYSDHDLEQTFFHLERAHILGEAFTFPHARAHWWMLKVGWRRRDLLEINGQAAMIVGATLNR